MRSGHKSNAVCTVIVKHFNAQSDHSPKLRDNITYSISVMDRHSRSKTSHFVDHSPLISVHDITTCMNVHGRYIILERLKNMHKQQAVFISVFTCKVLCFTETGSIRSKSCSRMSSRLPTWCSELNHPLQSISIVKQMSKRV